MQTNVNSHKTTMMRALGLTTLCLLSLLVPATAAMGQNVDWKTTVGEAVDTLQQYLRFNTTNPPGDVTEAAGFLQNILEREGISVTRYEAASGKINLSARLKGSGDAKPILLLHHMDVVPADASPAIIGPLQNGIQHRVQRRDAFRHVLLRIVNLNRH